MNERYLFRGKRLDDGEWVEGQRCTNGIEVWIVYDEDFSKETVYEQDKLNAWRFLEVDPSTVGQCTGLRDKNGTLIFEGDILRDDFFKNDIYNGRVSWNKRDLRYAFVKLDDKTRVISLSEFTAQDNITCNSVEVIGTIHTTPELMEGNDEL